MKKLSDCILVSINCVPPDTTVLIVGRKTPGEKIDIINAFQGEDALALYNLLIEKKGENKQ
jgi:hypothetical protein